MKRISIRTLGIALPASVLITVFSAFSYNLMGPKWSSPQVGYYVNPQNLDVPADSALTAIQQAASAWSQQSRASVQLVYAGSTTSTTLANNGHNDIFFRNEVSSSGSSVIATTYTWWDSNNRMLDADMVFWDAAFRFYAGTSGCSQGVYIEDVATHEFGHFLGLDHSSASDATMYPSITLCAQTSRSLASDDIAGIEAIYPPATSPTPTPTSTPTVTPSPTPTPAPSPTTSSTPTLSAPTNPRPSNNSSWVSTYADLYWSPVAGATSYDVYFGISSNPPLIATGVTSASYPLPRLFRGVLYYWRVIARSATQSVSGNIWRFRTSYY